MVSWCARGNKTEHTQSHAPLRTFRHNVGQPLLVDGEGQVPNVDLVRSKRLGRRRRFLHVAHFQDHGVRHERPGKHIHRQTPLHPVRTHIVQYRQQRQNEGGSSGHLGSVVADFGRA